MTNDDIRMESDDESEDAQENAFRLSKDNFPDVKSNLLYFIQLMSTNAYIYLGLIPIPGTEDVLFDVDQAKKSIDLVDVLINHAKPMLSESQVREMEAGLSQLKMNYVTKSKQQTDPESKTEE